MISSPSPMLGLARGIIERETASGDDELAVAVARTFERLYELLSTVVGAVGFAALMTRALHLSRADVPWLDDEVALESGIVSSGVIAAVQREGVHEVVRGTTLLLANILGLLGSFIGDDLTRRLVDGVWAKLPTTPLQSGDV